MRNVKNLQFSLFCQWSEHKFSEEMKKASSILDLHPEFLEWVAADLKAKNKGSKAGAKGMTAEQVLRAAFLKQQNTWTYAQLEYNCVDSINAKSFMRLDAGETFSASTFQRNISAISTKTWTKINDSLVRYAAREGVEKGRTVRMDATVVEANIHDPTDSSLMYDLIRICDKSFKKIRKKTRKAYYVPVSAKDAKGVVLSIQYSKNAEDRKPHYKKLIKGCKELQEMLPRIIKKFEGIKKLGVEDLQRANKCLPTIISQTERRVISGETVPAEEKIVSIFEDHADIIVKGRRNIEYGHKVFITAGKSGLVTDCQIVHGNPSDTEFFLDLVSKQKELYGKAPRQVAADGGFSSEDNFYDAKEMGVQDVCFSKAPGVEIVEMTKSEWVYRKLRNFRAGIEGVISVLKRAFNMDRVTWKGAKGFGAAVYSAVVAYNLTLLSR